MDTIIRKILVKCGGGGVAKKFEGKILPHIVKKLKEGSLNFDIDKLR